jgi:hypothetical protein
MQRYLAMGVPTSLSQRKNTKHWKINPTQPIDFKQLTKQESALKKYVF